MAVPNETAASDADVIFNRASLALAKTQRLIQSWLPPKTAEEIANAKTEEELEAEEREIFNVVPERLGLGAPLPGDGETLLSGRTAADERLKKQMLGKELRKLGMQGKGQSRGSQKPGTLEQRGPDGHVSPKPNAMATQHNRDEEDEEEESRFSLITSGRRNQTSMPVRQHASSSSDDERSRKVSNRAEKPIKRHATSYLDEVLSERASKKKRKKKG